MAQPLCLHKEKIETFDCSVNFLTVALLALRLQSATVNALFWQESSFHTCVLQVWCFASEYAVLYLAILMYDISNNRAPSKISELFVCFNMIH